LEPEGNGRTEQDKNQTSRSHGILLLNLDLVTRRSLPCGFRDTLAPGDFGSVGFSACAPPGCLHLTNRHFAVGFIELPGREHRPLMLDVDQDFPQAVVRAR
jgi:hypothetical protein